MLCVWLELPYKRRFACVSSPVLVVTVLCFGVERCESVEERKSCVCVELNWERQETIFALHSVHDNFLTIHCGPIKVYILKSVKS